MDDRDTTPSFTESLVRAAAADVADADEIKFDGRAGLGVILAPSSSITGLAVWVAEKSGGTFVPLYDDAGAAVAIADLTVGENGYAWVPKVSAVHPWTVLKLVSTAADEDVFVSMKS